MFEILQTQTFHRQFSRLPLPIQERFEKQFREIQKDPFARGKPLRGPRFKELKNKGYRAYFLIFEEKVIVLLVGVSDKKNQKKMIDTIIGSKEKFLKSIEE